MPLLDPSDDSVGPPPRRHDLPGSTVLGVAVGFEIWSGPIQNLAVERLLRASPVIQ